jgi:hypothetical protein
MPQTSPETRPLRAALPDCLESERAQPTVRTLVAFVGIVLIALLHAPAFASPVGRPASGAAPFVDEGGPVLSSAQIYLLYWGGAWRSSGGPFPTPGQITAALQATVAGPYLSGLAQYRAAGRPVVAKALLITTSDPPPTFTDKNVEGFLDAQLHAGVVPRPGPHNEALYIVVMPAGTIARDNSRLIGEHDYFHRNGQRIHFAWAADSDRLAHATRILTHELVESLTDPEGSAVLGTPGTCRQPGWCEIADVCRRTAVVDGIAVSPYWSDLAHTCVAPAPFRANAASISSSSAPAVHTSGSPSLPRM